MNERFVKMKKEMEEVKTMENTIKQILENEKQTDVKMEILEDMADIDKELEK